MPFAIPNFTNEKLNKNNYNLRLLTVALTHDTN